MSAVAHRDQKQVLDVLKLELQAVVSHLTRVLGTERHLLQEQHALLTAEPSLLHLKFYCLTMHFLILMYTCCR